MALSKQARNAALIVAAAMFMQFLDAVIIVTALPAIAQDFGVEPLAASAGITVYLLTSAIFVTMGSWLASSFGQRRVFIAATVLFTLASLACGLSQDLWQFVAARAIQGMGGALMVPVGRMIVLKNADQSTMVDTIALITWPSLIAPVTGPAIGGLITASFGWEWNFFVNVPIGLVAPILILRYVARDTDLRGTPLDWTGFVLLSGAMGALIWGMESVVHGFLPPLPAVLLTAIGFVLGAASLLWLRRAAHPLVSLAPFRVPTFARATLVASFGFRMTASATPFLIPLLFQFVFGLNPFEAGLYSGAYFLGSLVMKTVTTPLLRGFGFRTVMIVTGLSCATALALCALITPSLPIPLIVAILLGAGVTRSMQFTSLSTLQFVDLPREQQGAGSTIATMLHQLASVLGIVLAAVTLGLSRDWRGAGELGEADFQVAFLVVATLALVTSFDLFRLEPDAGQEASGHRPRGKDGET